MITRRGFLMLLGVAPAAAVAAKVLPVPTRYFFAETSTPMEEEGVVWTEVGKVTKFPTPTPRLLSRRLLAFDYCGILPGGSCDALGRELRVTLADGSHIYFEVSGITVASKYGKPTVTSVEAIERPPKEVEGPPLLAIDVSSADDGFLPVEVLDETGERSQIFNTFAGDA